MSARVERKGERAPQFGPGVYINYSCGKVSTLVCVWSFLSKGCVMRGSPAHCQCHGQRGAPGPNAAPNAEVGSSLEAGPVKTAAAVPAVPRYDHTLTFELRC